MLIPYLLKIKENYSKCYLQRTRNEQFGILATSSFRTLTGGIFYCDYRNKLKFNEVKYYPNKLPDFNNSWVRLKINKDVFQNIVKNQDVRFKQYFENQKDFDKDEKDSFETAKDFFENEKDFFENEKDFFENEKDFLDKKYTRYKNKNLIRLDSEWVRLKFYEDLFRNIVENQDVRFKQYFENEKSFDENEKDFFENEKDFLDKKYTRYAKNYHHKVLKPDSSYRTIIWLGQEIYRVNCSADSLFVKTGNLISKGFELSPDRFSKTSGIVILGQKHTRVLSITIKYGLVYEGQKFKNTDKKIYYPGEVIFSNIPIKKLSFCEHIFGKNPERLLIRPIELYELPYFNFKSIDSQNKNSNFKLASKINYRAKPNQTLRGTQNLNLIINKLVFRTKKLLNNQVKIELSNNRLLKNRELCYHFDQTARVRVYFQGIENDFLHRFGIA